MSWRCTFVVLALLLCRATVRGEDTTDIERTPWRGSMLGEQWRRDIPESPAVRVPLPITRDETVARVSLKEAIALALENNPGIEARRLEPVRQKQLILQAQGQYDPALAADILSRQTETPNASVLAGTPTLNIDDRTANLHLLKTLRPGTAVTVDFLNERLDNNARFNQLRPEYTPSLGFSLVQPLLQNFGWDFSYLVVRVAEHAADAAVYQYRAQLADFVETVVEAYWQVVQSREQLAVQRESKELADRTVRENEARVKVGLLAPVAVLEAQADAAIRQQQVIVAQNSLDVARQQLAQIAFYRPADTFVPRSLEPVEEAIPEPVATNVEGDLAVALEDRPEILASAQGIQVQQVNEKIAGNALLPRLDVVGSYSVNGLSGTNRPVTTAVPVLVTIPAGQPIPAGSSCVPAADRVSQLCLTNTSAQVPPSPFVGTRNDAYNRMTTNDFRSYSFGLNFQVPFANATARSQYVQSRIATSQAELNHRQLLSQVTLEVRQTIADVLATREAIDSTRVARELADENLKNQEKRHQVGMATTKDLLDFQLRRTTAAAQEVQAKIAYMISVSRWRRAQGKLLEHHQIVVDQPSKHSAPWFARF